MCHALKRIHCPKNGRLIAFKLFEAINLKIVLIVIASITLSFSSLLKNRIDRLIRKYAFLPCQHEQHELCVDGPFRTVEINNIASVLIGVRSFSGFVGSQFFLLSSNVVIGCCLSTNPMDENIPHWIIRRGSLSSPS